MDFNIPTWTKEVLGKSMTPSEFLKDTKAQDKVAEVKLGSLYDKYQNIADVAAVWFSGRPVANNTSKDVLGTSVPQYVKNIEAIFNKLA